MTNDERLLERVKTFCSVAKYAFEEAGSAMDDINDPSLKSEAERFIGQV
jgi:hypothetical protein